MDNLFPISNEDDLRTVETRLDSDEEYRDLLSKELADLGGEQVVHIVQRIMSKLFDDSLLVEYTYKNRGSNTKKSFYDLRICEIIFRTILSLPDRNILYIPVEHKIKAYLSQTKYRLSRFKPTVRIPAEK